MTYLVCNYELVAVKTVYHQLGCKLINKSMVECLCMLSS